mgnify:CR=1 FL=1
MLMPVTACRCKSSGKTASRILFCYAFSNALLIESFLLQLSTLYWFGRVRACACARAVSKRSSRPPRLMASCGARQS